jgi:hypothetical protein
MKNWLFILLVSNLVVAQTTWNGPTMTFTKTDNADPTLAANQDQITSNVWLTRGNSGGQLYNAKTESDSSKSTSPDDTQWALGTTSNLGTLTFSTFRGTSKPQDAVGQNMVLHLVTDDIYIDIKITSWTSGRNSGGGFSYERSTDPNLSIVDYEMPKLSLYPNPSTSFLRISGLKAAEPYCIYSILGGNTQSGIITENQEIDVNGLQTGIYMLQVSNTVLPFVKN